LQKQLPLQKPIDPLPQSYDSAPSPHHLLQFAIVDSLMPLCSPEMLTAQKQSGNRKRSHCGEILTADESLERRKSKQSAVWKRTSNTHESKSFKTQRTPDRSENKSNSLACNVIETFSTKPASSHNEHCLVKFSQCLKSNPLLSNDIHFYETRKDGDCLFSSMAYIIYGNDCLSSTKKIRKEAVNYICENFRDFSDSIFSTHEVHFLHEYRTKMLNKGVFADQHEILAIAKVYAIAITVYTGPDFHHHKSSTHQGTHLLLFDAKLHLQDLHYRPIVSLPSTRNYILLRSNGIFRPARILNCFADKSYEVVTMERVKEYWVWPKQEVRTMCAFNDVVRTVIPPSVSKRGQMMFNYTPELR
jgi:hypothetical protein